LFRVRRIILFQGQFIATLSKILSRSVGTQFSDYTQPNSRSLLVRTTELTLTVQTESGSAGRRSSVIRRRGRSVSAGR